jgi:hypothetical protein
VKNAYLRVLDSRLRGNDERIAVYDQTSQIQKLSCPGLGNAQDRQDTSCWHSLAGNFAAGDQVQAFGNCNIGVYRFRELAYYHG